MTAVIPLDLTLTVRRGTTSPGKAADLRDPSPADGTATLIHDRHLTDPGTVVWFTRILLRRHGYAVREVILDGMGPDITALFREASSLRLDVQLGSGQGTPEVITETGDPDRVWDTLTRVLDEIGAGRAEVPA